MSNTDCCAICQDAFEADGGFLTLSCKHVFHIRCATSWFAKQNKGTCPLCRKEMGEKEDIERHAFEEEEEEREWEPSSPIYFSREELDTLLRSLGGFGVLDDMHDIFHPPGPQSLLIHGDEHVTCLYMSEFRETAAENGARRISTNEWESLVEQQIAKEEDAIVGRRANELLASTITNKILSFSWHLLTNGTLVPTVFNPEEYTGISISDAYRLPHRVPITRGEAIRISLDCSIKIQRAWRSKRCHN